MAVHFHPLRIRRVDPEAAGAVAVTLEVPQSLRATFDFQPGQFLTLRTHLDGREERRSYSICSPRQRYVEDGDISVGIKPVEGGSFSRWAVQSLRAGDSVEAMPPEGRFVPRIAGARHRVGFAAGSGITPLLSIIATTLAQEPECNFTLVYGNQRLSTIMFHEALQDLKDRYPTRFTLIHVLSRQAQETALFNGRIDEAKVSDLLRRLLPAAAMDEVFLCGPEGMIDAVQRALLAAGVAAERVHAERFYSDGALAAPAMKPAAALQTPTDAAPATVRLEIILDGKSHAVAMLPQEQVLEAGLGAGLDLPYSCKSGVCCTCRARVLEGRVEMDRNYTLEPWEMDKGFVLTCQARALTERIVVSYDER